MPSIKKTMKKMALRASQTSKQVFGRNAYSIRKTSKLSGKKYLEEKVLQMMAQSEKRKSSSLLKLGKTRDVPLTIKEWILCIREIADKGAFEAKLLKKPMAAAFLAEKMKNTKYAKDFKAIAEEAARKNPTAAEKKEARRHRIFAETHREKVRKIMKRQAEIAKIDRE